MSAGIADSTASGFASSTITRASDDELLEWLHENRRTDGLPVVLPTPDRVRELVLAAEYAGYDPDLVLGRIGPSNGQATIEKIAVNAVMAGCRPEHMPVVVAAVKALCDPRLDTTEIQATTHNLAPLTIVNGPVRADAGLHGGYGVFGYGHRANLSIGRAVRLCMINLGGGWPGVSDMTVMGHPGKISFCIAEDEENSPFPPLHTSRGFTAEQSAVTLVCVSAPHQMLIRTESDVPESPGNVLDLIAATIAGLGNNNSYVQSGTVVVCLNPDHARFLADAGYDRAAIQQELFERASNPTSVINRFTYGLLGTDADQSEPWRALESPDSVLVVVTGGSGLYSAVLPSWGLGPHKNTAVSYEVVTTDMCEIPLRVE